MVEANQWRVYENVSVRVTDEGLSHKPSLRRWNPDKGHAGRG